MEPTGEPQENITVHNACQSKRLQPSTTQPQYYLCKKSDEFTEDTKEACMKTTADFQQNNTCLSVIKIPVGGGCN